VVVRKAKTERPKQITVHRRDEVPVPVEEPAKDEATGRALVDVLPNSPLHRIKLERLRIRSRLRGVDL